MGAIIIKVLLILVISKAQSELITSNVTKLQGSRSIQIQSFTNWTTARPPSTNRFTNGTTTGTTTRPIYNGSLIDLTKIQPTTERSFVLKAISVNAADTGRSLEFPQPPNFHFSEKDDLEETFTYQVKKQKRPINFPTDYNNELNLLKQRVRSDTYEEVRNFVNDLNRQMNEKIRHITTTIDLANNGAMRNISSLNSSFHRLNVEVSNLTVLSKESSRSIRTLQLSHELERTLLHSKVANLTGQLKELQGEKTEEMKRVMESLSAIKIMMANTSQELRVHEAHIRYGQQVMASMKGSIERNDEKITGLQVDGGPQWTEQTVGCGGVIIANSGIISYKLRQPYTDNERCVWIIRANRRSKINLQLVEDGFQNQSNSDFLSVTEFAGEEQHPVTLVTSSRLEHGDKVLHTFQGPVIFITFYSDSSDTGTGFILKFEGIGNRSNAATTNAIRYTNLHFAGPSGTFKYPKAGVSYQPNELVAVAINPHGANSVKIHMKASDLEKDEYCEFDSVNFYGSVTGSYALTKRYCQQSEEFNGEIIQSSDGTFLVIFRSDASTQFSGFQFAWEVE